MTVNEIIEKLSRRDVVRPMWIMNVLNLSEESFNERFGHITVITNDNGFTVMSAAEVVSVLSSL